MEDIEINVPHHRPLRKTVSPITLFVSVPGVNKLTKENENTLKPVAIQMDMDKGMTYIVRITFLICCWIWDKVGLEETWC